MSLDAPAPPAPPLARLDGAVAVRLALLTLLAATWVVRLATAGHDASLSRLASDLQEGRTRAVLVLGDRVVWRTDGLLPKTLDLPAEDRYATGQDNRVQVHDGRELEAFLGRFPDVPTTAVHRFPGWLDPERALSVLGLMAFVLLVAGPDPWRFNRWGWFWLMYVGKDVGLGLAGFLLLSGPLPWRAHAPAGRRRDGGQGFALMLVLSLSLLVVLIGLSLLLGPVTGGYSVRSN